MIYSCQDRFKNLLFPTIISSKLFNKNTEFFIKFYKKSSKKQLFKDKKMAQTAVLNSLKHLFIF